MAKRKGSGVPSIGGKPKRGKAGIPGGASKTQMGGVSKLPKAPKLGGGM